MQRKVLCFGAHKDIKMKVTATKYTRFATMLAISSLVAIAPSQAAQVAGDNEVQLSGGFFHASGSDTGTMTADVSYGKFLTDRWELGLRQTLGYSFIDDADNQWNASTIPFVNYHFRGLSPDDRFQPFLGAFIGAAYNENDTTFTTGPNLGFKYFLDDQTFIVTRYRYEWFANDLDIGELRDNSSDGNHVITVGFGYVWGGAR